MLVENNKSKIILGFCSALFCAFIYYKSKGTFDHKIHNGKITAKMILESRTSMRGKMVYFTPETYIFMVQKDTITEKFEVNKVQYNSLKVGDNFTETKTNFINDLIENFR